MVVVVVLGVVVLAVGVLNSGVSNSDTGNSGGSSSDVCTDVYSSSSSSSNNNNISCSNSCSCSGKLEGKYSLESTDPRESEIRAPPQPLPYLMPIPSNTLFYNKKFITAFLSIGLGNTS